MEELLQKVIIKAYEISTKTKHDVFLNYSGHVNAIDVSYYENGYDEEKDIIYIVHLLELNEKNAIEKLQFVLKELEKLEV